MRSHLSGFGMSFIENMKKNNHNNEWNGLYKNCFKRSLDVMVSCGALIVLSPVIVSTALLVKKNLGSPVIYTQERPGLNERIFKLYKFRTMTNETDNDGNLLPDEDRLTDFGKMLRSTSLDELPELINILKGDMSFVGPRPLLVRYLPFYKDAERVRHSVRPGLTGLAQVNGRNNVNWDRRLEYDVQYVKNITLYGDLRIVFRTIIKVLGRSDIASGKQLVVKDLDDERKDQMNKI